MTARYARVIVDVRPAHLDHPFDYIVPDGCDVAVGHRVRVRFAGRLRDGWVVGVDDGLIVVDAPSRALSVDDLRPLYRGEEQVPAS